MSLETDIAGVKSAINRNIEPELEETWQRYVTSFNAARGIETGSLTENERFARFLIYMERMITYCVLEYKLKDLTSTTPIGDSTLSRIIGNQAAAFYAHYVGGCLSNETELDPVSDHDFMEAVSVMYAENFSPATIIEQITTHPSHCVRTLEYINTSVNFNLESVALALRIILLITTKESKFNFASLNKGNIVHIREVEVDAMLNTINVLVNTLAVGAMFAED